MFTKETSLQKLNFNHLSSLVQKLIPLQLKKNLCNQTHNPNGNVTILLTFASEHVNLTLKYKKKVWNQIKNKKMKQSRWDGHQLIADTWTPKVLLRRKTELTSSLN